MSTKAQREIAHKLHVFEHARHSSNVAFTYRYFGISRDTFYRWKRNYLRKGEQGLINSKPCPENPKLRTPKAIEEQIIYVKPITLGNYELVAICIATIKSKSLLAVSIRCLKEIS